MIPSSNIISPFSQVKEFRGGLVPGIKLRLWMGPSRGNASGGGSVTTNSYLVEPSRFGTAGSAKIISMKLGESDYPTGGLPNPDLGSPVLATGSAISIIGDGADLNNFGSEAIKISDYINHAFWSSPIWNPSGLPAYDATDNTWFFRTGGTVDHVGGRVDGHFVVNYLTWDTAIGGTPSSSDDTNWGDFRAINRVNTFNQANGLFPATYTAAIPTGSWFAQLQRNNDIGPASIVQPFFNMWDLAEKSTPSGILTNDWNTRHDSELFTPDMLGPDRNFL